MPWGAAIGAAGGIASSLIGSSGSESTTKLPRHIRAAGKAYGQDASAFGDQYGGSGAGLWDQSRLAGVNPLVGQGEDSILSQIPGLQQQLSGVTGTLEGFLDYDPNSAQNMARRDAMTNNVQSMFNESIRPGIENRGTSVGQFGGPQQSLAMAASTAPLSRALADAEVSMMEGDQNRAFQAMGMAPSLFGQAATIPGGLMSQIGSSRTDRDQLTLGDQIQMMEAERNNYLQNLQASQGLVSGQGAGGTVQSGQQGNPIQGALGGAIMGQQFGSLWGGGNNQVLSMPTGSDTSFGFGGAFDGSF